MFIRRAPELMVQRRALDAQRAAASEAAEAWAKGVRAAERDLNRLHPMARSPRFRVIEYARPRFEPLPTPPKPGP